MSSLIVENELEDFKNTLVKYDYSEDEFEWSGIENSIPADGIFQITGMVIIKLKKTGIVRTYKAGHGSHWIVDFEDDLKASVFNR
jgi:hypothetical protein